MIDSAQVSNFDEENEDCSPLEDVEILTEVLLALVGRPEEVRVETSERRPDEMHFLVHVAKEDVGKVIGKNGETVSIIRKLFGRIAASRGQKVFIDIQEPGRPKPYRSNAFRRNAA